MKTATITISYDEEKLAALRLYLGQKNQTVEEELLAATDSLYTKTVPNNVREFIDLRAGKTVSEPKKRKPKPNIVPDAAEPEADASAGDVS